MEEISVLGLGYWGTALAHHLSRKGHPVLGWTIDPKVAANINDQQAHPNVFSETKLEPCFKATTDLVEASGKKNILVALPSAALAEVIPRLGIRSDSLLISAVKGLEHDSALTPLQFFERCFKLDTPPAVVSGPSFAKDLMAGRPLGLVAASRSEAVAHKVATMFSGDSVKVYASLDPLGVELGGILKNIIAVAAGVSDGLGLGDSARAGIITRGLAEIMRLAQAMGGEQQTLAGLSGLGDLTMTASSDTSRNRTLGLRLGRGEELETIIATLGSVAEGARTTPIVLELAKKYKVEMPITEQINRLLNGEISPAQTVAALIKRPVTKEFS